MAKHLNSIKNRPIRVVEFGAGYEIHYSPADNEYSAHITYSADCKSNCIGYTATKDAARDLIFDYAAGQAEYRREVA